MRSLAKEREMRRLVCAVTLFVLPLLSLAAENSTVLDALKALPKEEVKNLARIEAYDGQPLPERWHFLIHDPNVESGVREYVVAGGELVVTRGVSQFTESLKETDVIGCEQLKIDSDKLARLVKQFGAANKVTVTKVSYHLHKRPEASEPLWRVNCYNEGDKAIGALVVKATDGTVVAHDGFATRPDPSSKDKAGSLTAARWGEDDNETPVKARSRASAWKAEATEANNTQKKTTAAETKRSNSKRKARAPSTGRSSERAFRPEPRELPPPIMVRETRNPIRNFFRRFAR